MTRRALADLPLEWATTDMIAKLSPGGAGLPERTVALAAFHALPTESNLLFTGYVDLRAAEVERAAPAHDELLATRAVCLQCLQA